MLSDAERERYSRQIRLFAEEGQERLKKKRVFIAGAGGLGSVISLYMAASGFGRIRIADCDSVDLSNLNRQILHGSLDLGRSKAQSALETLSDINPEGEIEALQEKISAENINALVQGCDMIMDAMDNFPARYLLNHAALERRIPLFHGAISGFQGQATTILPGRTACLRCIFPRAPPAQESPALGSTCGVIGSRDGTTRPTVCTASGSRIGMARIGSASPSASAIGSASSGKGMRRVFATLVR